MAVKTSIEGLGRNALHHAVFANAGFTANVNDPAMARFRYVTASKNRPRIR
jgi:hypothetical protein